MNSVSVYSSTKNGNRGGSSRLDCRNSNQSDVICGILDPADDISGICENSVWLELAQASPTTVPAPPPFLILELLSLMSDFKLHS